ncbi:MBL fold metallo-hydrolase [Novosphingobium sp. PASSN1]|uniref:MBL fold metallo-hydrolase n=1 Tax=Novosphingobium sp. PASSN1 TaxID=2015561 RepID=UPI000BC7BFAD|nr:MBL fold metallo-hydrolase [Novosphingobium sp. PASSN1]OYU34215.1 MAG: MBL fold metallo-hydrolase [Novosphingobium sp. PASSN1]
MLLEQVATGGCQSYLVGCPTTHMAALIDPASGQVDHYLGLAAQHGVRIRYLVDTHTHADHFSATLEMKQMLGVPVVMHALAPAVHADMRLEHGQTLMVGALRFEALHTPGHTRDSMCLFVAGADGGHVFTGDTLLFGGTGRSDLPSGDPEQLYDSLFERLLRLDPATAIHPAHDYKGGQASTIGAEIATNPRLQKRDRAEFVAMMRRLNLSAPTHLTEALRTNMNGGVPMARLLAEATARVPFISLAGLADAVSGRDNDLIVLDVRERDLFGAAHVPGALHLPRGQLELLVNAMLPDPTRRIVTVCEQGKISTLAAATLRTMGFTRVMALDGGMKAWRDAGFPSEGTVWEGGGL